jgi:electron transport complex protein RnfG
MITFARKNKLDETMIKKKLLMVAFLVCAITAQADDVMTKTADGTYIVNTTTLAKDVEGYAGPTPVEVHIKNNKIVKVVPLKTQDGPKYVAKVKKEMLPKYESMNVKKGTVQDVDAVTGATFTSKAIQENVRRAVEYYKKHK